MKKIIPLIVSSFLVIVVTIGVLCSYITPVSAEEATQTTDICIVFDNTESTYQSETWCRYKYAMTILADFIDFEMAENC